MRPSCSPELPAIKTWCREGHSKAQPRDYRSRALPLELSRRHGAGCQNRTDSFSFTKRAHRQQCLPGKSGAGAGSRTPVSSLPKMCPVQTGPRQQCGAGGVTRKLNHRVTNAALFLLSYTSGNGAGDRTRTGVWTLARSHLSHWKTPALWSGVRESNSSAGLPDQCLRRLANPA